MKVYSWNMLFVNTHQDAAFAFVRDCGFDVFCLQEVPEAFLERLKQLPCHIAIELEAERLFETRIKTYLVTLSKFPILNQERFGFPDYESRQPSRAKKFVRFMRRLNWAPIENRGGFYADIEIESRAVRVFNLHLILAAPAWRREEFDAAMMHLSPQTPGIVCGDFNILESWHITIFNWLLGGNWGDVVLFTQERTQMERRFAQLEFTNPLRGYMTHPFSNSQLDHILLSRELQVESVGVVPHGFGSDHRPILVETSA